MPTICMRYERQNRASVTLSKLVKNTPKHAICIKANKIPLTIQRSELLGCGATKFASMLAGRLRISLADETTAILVAYK